MTGLYNVLEALRAGRPLTEAERDIHDAGHVSLLRDLHDRLDREVAAAYGWQPNLSAALDMEAGAGDALPDWPKSPAEQATLLRAALASEPAAASELARRFRRAPRARVEDMLQALVAMGQAHQARNGS